MIFGAPAIRVGPDVALGVGCGVVWWVLGVLVLKPAKPGVDLFTLDTTAWQSPMRHTVHRAVLGAVYTLPARRVPA